MARARTLLELRTEVRALTDTVDDEHASDAIVNVWINQGIAELWRKLVLVGAYRYALQETIATTAGTFSYDLEDDFLSILSVWRVVGTQRLPLQNVNPVEAPYRSSDTRNTNGLPRYWIPGGGLDGSGTAIYFDPDPGTYTYGYWYIQTAQNLAADDDTFDGICGFEDWVVLYAALRVFIRQQDPEQAGIVQEMARIESSIMASAARRDVGHAPRIADVRPRRGAFRGYR